SQIEISRDLLTDQVKTEVNQNYQNYVKALERIKILETAITQARENDRTTASQYQNKVATATERVDAQSELFQAQINLELARADAQIAYYTLLKSTGKISQK
ncbi:MAG: TolC family protein, partial [Bacteroidota bacterium]|nr:TolC family protein [Bacteroidota bacterium]